MSSISGLFAGYLYLLRRRKRRDVPRPADDQREAKGRRQKGHSLSITYDCSPTAVSLISGICIGLTTTLSHFPYISTLASHHNPLQTQAETPTTLRNTVPPSPPSSLPAHRPRKGAPPPRFPRTGRTRVLAVIKSV
jgi:hypothetical protein